MNPMQKDPGLGHLLTMKMSNFVLIHHKTKVHKQRFQLFDLGCFKIPCILLFCQQKSPCSECINPPAHRETDIHQNHGGVVHRPLGHRVLSKDTNQLQLEGLEAHPSTEWGIISCADH